MDKEEIDVEALHSFYKELQNLIGVECMLKVHAHYKGSQLVIPSHLYDRKLAADKIIELYNGHNSRELARRYRYSQKWVSDNLRKAREQEQQVADLNN
ncbi:MAG TPA: hypothetical protein DCE17_00455 [Lactobacillus sp.]|nr:hypothetical protein [Lactobacillus sp.]